MNIPFPNEKINPHIFFTKAGYHAHRNGSYAMRLGGNEFPRFHCYLQENKNGGMSLSLHLDQSPAVYMGHKAHHGESKSEVVLEEAERLKRWIAYFNNL